MASTHRIIIVAIDEFPETRYDYERKMNEETGKKLLREEQIYVQNLDIDEAKMQNIIKAVNGL